LGPILKWVFFFGYATAAYRDNDPKEVLQALVPLVTPTSPTTGAISTYMRGDTTEQDPRNTRYLNLFRMAGNPEVMHARAAGLRSPTTKETDPHNQCKSEWPCKARFNKFVSRFADKNDRIYAEQMGMIARAIRDEGEHGGVGLPGANKWDREWDALSGWLAAFGVKDANEKLYLPLDWARTMVYNGTFPLGWTKRQWTFFDVADHQRAGNFESKNIHRVNNMRSALDGIKCWLGWC